MGNGYQSKYVIAGGIKTHFLEAGEGEPLVLLHSGEFGASAELSWEYNIEALSKHFHVYAPDWLGYGKSEKLFSFTDMFNKRVQHIRAFLDVMCIERAHFIGNSMGGTMLAAVAAEPEPIFPIKKMIICSAGGFVPQNEARELLNSYDCSKEHMKKILQILFYDYKWSEGQYLERRYQASLEPGAWECTAAARFKPPVNIDKTDEKKIFNVDPSSIQVSTLIVAGKDDMLRLPGYADELQRQIKGSKLKVFENARHCPHIEYSDEFNRLAIEFLQ